MMTRYDDALPAFAKLVSERLGENAILENFFLRDSSGRLTLVLTTKIDEADKERLGKAAAALHPYVESASASLAYPEELLDPELLDPDIGVFEYIDHPKFQGFVRLVERRIVGQDWLEAPKPVIAGAPPIVVFASHKGGVGRSTALAVFAMALSERGFDSLVVDLDLEAPGIGNIFLNQEHYPKFGTLDYFVESSLGDLDDHFFDDMLATSPLTRGRGRIHVCPAIGSAGDQNPQNVLGKISRAYLEGPTTNTSFLDRSRTMIERLAKKNRYDVILVDARAGLNEATSAAILGLGAEVMLFGVDTPQTFSGYHYLLSYMKRFTPDTFTDGDWRLRLRMIHAKASADVKKQADFRTRTFDLFADTIYDEEEGVDENSFNFDYEDSSAPHFAWVILNDSNYYEFNPIGQPEQMTGSLYERTFGSFIEALFDSVGLDKSDVSENS